MQEVDKEFSNNLLQSSSNTIPSRPWRMHITLPVVFQLWLFPQECTQLQRSIFSYTFGQAILLMPNKLGQPGISITYYILYSNYRRRHSAPEELRRPQIGDISPLSCQSVTISMFSPDLQEPNYPDRHITCRCVWALSSLHDTDSLLVEVEYPSKRATALVCFIAIRSNLTSTFYLTTYSSTISYIVILFSHRVTAFGQGLDADLGEILPRKP